MTAPRARNLLQTQFKRALASGKLRTIFQSKQSYPLARKMILENKNNLDALNKIVNPISYSAKHGNKTALNFLFTITNEKANPNPGCREWVLATFVYLAEKGEEEALPGLLIGMNDSRDFLRDWAIRGLTALAEKGNKRAHEELSK